MTERSDRHRRVLRLALVVVAGAVLVAGDCKKEASFFFPGQSLLAPPDTTPPVFSGHLPPSTVMVLNAPNIMVIATDEGSGIDPATAEATLPDGTGLPVTVDLMGPGQAMLTIPTGMLAPEETAKIGVTIQDQAGNEGSTSFDVVFDPLSPLINAGFPGLEVQSSDPEFTFVVPVEIKDASFASATAGISLAGPDAECGTGDDAAIPEGMGPGEVEDVEQTFSTDAFEASFRLFNPVGPGGDPLVYQVCLEIQASDAARGKQGEPNPNVATSISRTDLTWMSPVPAGGTPLVEILGFSLAGQFRFPLAADPGRFEEDLVQSNGAGALVPATVVGRASFEAVGEYFGQDGTLFQDASDLPSILTMTGILFNSGSGALVPADATLLIESLRIFTTFSRRITGDCRFVIRGLRGGEEIGRQEFANLPDSPGELVWQAPEGTAADTIVTELTSACPAPGPDVGGAFIGYNRWRMNEGQ